jgi:hypothetical protein
MNASLPLKNIDCGVISAVSPLGPAPAPRIVHAMGKLRSILEGVGPPKQ